MKCRFNIKKQSYTMAVFTAELARMTALEVELRKENLSMEQLDVSHIKAAAEEGKYNIKYTHLNPYTTKILQKLGFGVYHLGGNSYEIRW